MDRWNLLTSAEFRVCELIANGYSLEEIAEDLGKSVNTVSNQAVSGKAKLGVQKGTELSKSYFTEVKGVDKSTLPTIKKFQKISSSLLLLLMMVQVTSMDDDFTRLRNFSREQRTTRSAPVPRARRIRNGCTDWKKYALA